MSDDKKHALLSPSSAHRWTRCPGSVSIEHDLPNETSMFADEGSKAHELAELELTGKIVNYANYPADMPGEVAKYVSYVKSLGGLQLYEQSLSIAHITNEKEATGTSDAVIVMPDGELIVVDLKYGLGVRVYAEENEQLILYAAAALEEFDLVYEINSVRMVIHQPRLHHVSEWAISIAELNQRVTNIRVASGFVWGALIYKEKFGYVNQESLAPGDKQCQWCRAKTICPALAKQVQTDAGASFEDLNSIGKGAFPHIDDVSLSIKMKAVDLIEAWCGAVRKEAYRKLINGETVDGFKLVTGRRGDRAWKNAKEAEEMLKSMRIHLKDMYVMKVISPSQAEALSKKAVIGARQWPKLQPLITRADGKPAMVPESDKRPAIGTHTADNNFENLEESIC